MSNEKKVEIEKLISYGKYKDALTILKSIKNERTLSDDEILTKMYIKIFIYLDKGFFEKGRKLTKKMMDEAKKKKNSLREIDAISGRIEHNLPSRLLIDSYELLDKSEEILNKLQDRNNNEIKKREAYILYLRARTLHYDHKFVEALGYYEKSYELRKEIQDKFGMMYSLLNWGSLLTVFGNFEDSRSKINQSLSLAEELNLEVAISWSLINLAWIEYSVRDSDKAISYIEKCLLICELKNNSYQIALCNNTLGTIMYEKGDYKEAISLINKSLNLALELGDPMNLATIYNNLATIYSQTGEFKKAKEYCSKILEFPDVLNTLTFKTLFLTTIGKIHGECGDFIKAKESLLEALDSINDLNMVIYYFRNYKATIAKIYHYLIILSLNNKEFIEANLYLKELLEVSKKNASFKQIDQIYLLDKASILKSSDRLVDKMQAEVILKELIKEEHADYDTTIEAMVILCELLLYELELSGNENIFNEIEQITDKLLNISKSQNLYNVLSETYFFKAKLSLLHLNTKEARYLLTKAQNIAKEHGLTRLANKISSEHDSFLEHLDEWEEKVKQDVPLQELLQFTQHDFLYSKMVKQKLDKLNKENETAVSLLLLHSYDGRCFYNRVFEEMNINDGDLITNFISAINSFGKEVFSHSGTIDRIKHGDYMIVFNSKGDLLFGYVFKGQSYSALSKLDYFIDNLYNLEDIIREIKSSVLTHMEISARSYHNINKLADEIFVLNKGLDILEN